MPKNKQEEVEDIFAETDRDRSKLAVRQQNPQRKNRVRPTTRPTPVESRSAKQSRVKISRLAIFLLLPLIVIAGGAALVSSGVFSLGGVTDQTTTDVGADTTAAPGGSQSPLDDAILPPSVTDSEVDSDGDGLSDEQEQLLGLDPLSRDTDNDGLFDREEVEVYNTDPLDSDTDNDGNLDGTEVASGYDPNGAGLLLDVNAAITNLNNQ